MTSESTNFLNGVTVSVVIPVYNNAPSLKELHGRLETTFLVGPPIKGFEVQYIDDGSQDGSWQEICSIQAHYGPHVRGIKLSRNFGQLAAMIAGWEASSADAIINLSADLQDPPEIIPEMLRAWANGADLVIGLRQENQDGISRKFTSAVARRLVANSHQNMPSKWFDYTLMSSRVATTVTAMKGRFRFTQGDMLYAGFNQAFVAYTREKRPYGKSGYDFWSRVKNFTDAILDSSYLAIQFFTRLGLIFSISAVLYATWIIVARTAGLLESSGWAPIMVVLLVGLGLIMMMLGIIAEYLWRIYDSTRGRPTYVVDQTI